MSILSEIYRSGYYELSAIFVVLALLFSILNCAFKKYDWHKICCGIAFAMYLFIVLYATIFNRDSLLENSGISLIPFASYKFAFNGNEEGFRTCFMNALLFYPFGFLLSCLDMEFIKKRRWLIVLMAFVFSLNIEAVQYIFHLGYAEIDDVIHNTLGAFIGVAMSVIFNKLFDLAKSKMKKK